MSFNYKKKIEITFLIVLPEKITLLLHWRIRQNSTGFGITTGWFSVFSKGNETPQRIQL